MQTPSSSLPVNRGHRLRRSVISILSSALLIGSLSGCSTPHLAQTNNSAHLDACTSALLDAQESQSLAESSMVASLRTVSALNASHEWLTVSASCSMRFSEGVVRSAAAYHLATTLASRSGLNSIIGSYGSFGSTDAPSTLSNATVRSMAVSQDKAAYALEILASRERPTNSTYESLSLTHRGLATDFAEDAMGCASGKQEKSCTDTDDPREKLYSVSALLAHTNDYTDTATGLHTNVAAAIEMNCGLEELAAADDPGSQVRAQLAAFIARDIASAYSLGYPSAPLPLTEQSAAEK